MDDVESSSTDALLEELGGCGRFQIILTVFISLVSIPSIFGYMVDSFGMYNPGWRCLDNVTTTTYTPVSDNGTVSYTTTTVDLTSYRTSTDNSTTPTDITEYGRHSCDLYKACQRVEFSPDANTYVTDWNLLCDRAWIFSTILSIRMAGNMFSTFIVGYIGDRYGRKIPVIFAIIVQFLILNFIAIFSVSWLMYAIIAFFMGCMGSFSVLLNVLGFEYVAPDWRVKVSSIPTWSLISVLFSLTAMAVHDWQYIRVITLVLGGLVFVPIFWVPKSVRWLTVHGKDDEVLKVVKKIARINKTDIPERFRDENDRHSLMKKCRNEVELGELGGDEIQHSEECQARVKAKESEGYHTQLNDGNSRSGMEQGGGKSNVKDDKKQSNEETECRNEINVKDCQTDGTSRIEGEGRIEAKSYTVLSLFRQKGFLVPTLVVGFIAMVIDMLYFALSFGVISLPGNLYTNMILSSVTELPANIISFFLADLFKRRPSTLSMFLLVSLCLAGIVVVDQTTSGETRHIAEVSLVMLAKLLLFVGWIIFSTSITELYPTVVRTTVKSYMWFTSGIGGIIAPYLIPSNPETFYISFLVMAIMFIVCSVLVCFVPETKGRPLSDDFVDDNDEGDDDNDDAGDNNDIIRGKC